MASDRTRQSFRLFVGALLTVGTSVVGGLLTSALTDQKGLLPTLGWGAVGIIATFFYLRWQSSSGEESPDAIEARVGQLRSELRSQVQRRSYGARSKLIAAPLKELHLDITPRVGWVRDPRLTEPVSEEAAGIVAAFKSSRRRLLIVGEPGSGKTTAAYALIEHLDKTEGDERVPLLVNLSAWQAQENFEAFLVDYLCSEVGYQIPKPRVASAFISSRRYTLVLDGLDEIADGLRKHFSERLDAFVRGLTDEIAVVVTCRTQDYRKLKDEYSEYGLGLVQAVEMLPLSNQQLDSAFGELAKFDETKDWERFLTQRHLTACQRARDLLRNPLFLNLAVASRLRPRELLNRDEGQGPRDLVLDRYLDRVSADYGEHEPKAVRRYLTWIARFLNGAANSPVFGCKTTDSTVFDLADLTPPTTPWRYRLVAAPVVGLVWGMFVGLVLGGLVWGGPAWGLVGGLVVVSFAGSKADSADLTLVWHSTSQQRRDLLDELVGFLVGGVVGALIWGMFVGLYGWLGIWEWTVGWLVGGMVLVMVGALVLGLFEGLRSTQYVLSTYRTPKEMRARSLIAALTFALVWGLFVGLVGWWWGWVFGWVVLGGLFGWLVGGLVVGLTFGLHCGGWFVLLQKVAHRHLHKAGNLPPRPYDFLEWGIERQIFRRVGGGVRFRHDLIQQHLAPRINTPRPDLAKILTAYKRSSGGGKRTGKR